MPESSTRDRLLDCAEQLFGARGLAGVSLRAINAEAGLSPAALHYHFGSQQVLVEALLERRMPSLMERRRQLLDALEELPGTPSARQILDALLRPMAELVAEGGERGVRYLRLIHRLRADDDLDAAFVIQRFPGGVDRLVPLLERALPALPAALIELRLGLAIDAMLRNLARGPHLAGASWEQHTHALLDFLAGALEAPVTGELV